MKQKKVGLCLAGFNGTNYGMLLQAYATQQVVEMLGFETEIIDYRSGRDKHIRPSVGALYIAGKKLYTVVRNKVFPKTGEQWTERNLQNKQERYEIAAQFRNNYFKNVVVRAGYTQLYESSKAYDSVLVGSDQLWQPDISFTNFYTLRFAAEGVNRISYATSLGVSAYPRYCWKQAAEFWSKINYLSVREEQGKKVIQSIVDIPVKVVADPTYLLTSEQWWRLIPYKRLIEEQYVLCYFLSNDTDAKALAVQYAHKKGMKCVGILSSECNANDDEVYDEVLVGKSPQDFINLIRGASCVFTDSFHGLAFSVINSIDFFIFYRKRNEVRASRNSRIDNILSSWGLKDRLIVDPKKETIIDKKIDYASVQNRVADLRRDSLSFLTRALNREKINEENTRTE